MTSTRTFTLMGALSAVALAICGCYGYQSTYLGGGASPHGPLGTLSDPMWQVQEDNAEPSKFVVYQHEWQLNTTRLNTDGEDHVRQIAARLSAGQNFPVLVERSRTSPRETTEYKYPVHVNPELDMKRREVIVQALTSMGVSDASQRTIVSPALTRGFTDAEAERAYMRSMYNFNSYGGGFGGGGFGGFGGLGSGGFGLGGGLF